MMKTISLAAVVLAVSTNAFAGSITISVIPNLSPNIADSSGNSNSAYATWATNVLNALQSAQNSAGTANTPGYFTKTSVTNPGSVVATNTPGGGGFDPSWMGTVNPASPFNTQAGNLADFAVAIIATGGDTFTLNDLQFTLTDTAGILDGFADSNNDLGGTTWFDLQGGGIFPGGYLALNGSTVVTDDNAPLTALYFSGVADAFLATCVSGVDCGVPSLENMDISAAQSGLGNAFPGGPADILTGTYSVMDINEATFTGSSTLTLSPEPSTWLFLVSSIPAVAMLRRRRNR
jgi:hypothetical protein